MNNGYWQDLGPRFDCFGDENRVDGKNSPDKKLVKNIDRKTITGDITCAGGTVGGAELN